ncbi:MAG: TonB-dependent receptor [Pseudomonadota bacterium]
MKKRFYLTLIFFVLSFSAMAWAEKIVSMDEVVVTATKTTEQRKDIPNSILIADDIDIESSPATSIGDFLGGEPGVDWRTRGDYGGAVQELHIRGMGGDGTQVLVNGLAINSPSLGSADLGKVSANNIERIEVVKGSGSVLYGSGAMGGTVNIMTKSPEHDQTDLIINTGYGSEGTYEVEFQNGMFITKTLGYYLTAHTDGTDGFRDNTDGQNKDISLKLLFDMDNRFKLSLYGDLIDRESGRPGPKPPEGTRPFYVNGVAVYNGESSNLLNSVTEEDKHLILKVEGTPLDWLSYHIQTDYTDMISKNYSRYYDAFTLGNLPGSRTKVANQVLGLEADATLKPFDKTTLLLGMQYKEYDWENISTTLDGYGNATTSLPGTANLYSMGVFGELQYRPCKFIKGSAGIRHEKNSEFGDEVLPRFGLVINPTETTAVKFNTGNHFKAPTPNDLFWPYEDWGWGMGAQGNSSLKPETGRHTDIGIEQSLADNKIFLNLTYFTWDIQDKIEWVPDASFFYRPENLSTYEASGFEAGAMIGPYQNMTLSLNYTYTDAQEQKPGGAKRQSRYTANDFFKATLNYWLDFGLDLTATYRYTGKRPAIYAADTDTEPTRYLDAYGTLDLKARQTISENWSVSVQVNNVFDKSYGTYAETFYDQSGTSTLSQYPGAGRSFYASMTYSF